LARLQDRGITVEAAAPGTFRRSLAAVPAARWTTGNGTTAGRATRHAGPPSLPRHRALRSRCSLTPLASA